MTGIKRRCSEDFDAEDVLHEAFVELWKQVDGLLPEKSRRGSW